MQSAEEYFYSAYRKAGLKDDYGAIADYTKAIDNNPNDADSYHNRGVPKYFLNDNKVACQDGRKAQQLECDASQLINDACN